MTLRPETQRLFELGKEQGKEDLKPENEIRLAARRRMQDLLHALSPHEKFANAAGAIEGQIEQYKSEEGWDEASVESLRRQQQMLLQIAEERERTVHAGSSSDVPHNEHGNDDDDFGRIDGDEEEDEHDENEEHHEEHEEHEAAPHVDHTEHAHTPAGHGAHADAEHHDTEHSEEKKPFLTDTKKAAITSVAAGAAIGTLLSPNLLPGFGTLFGAIAAPAVYFTYRAFSGNKKEAAHGDGHGHAH